MTTQPLLAALAAALMAVGAAWAEPTPRLSTADQTRIDQWEEHRARAVAHANLHAPAEALDELAHVLDGHPRVWLGEDFTGPWRCRAVRLSEAEPVRLFPWGDCRVTEDAQGLMLEKRGGSWRTRGRLYPRSDRELLYIDASARQVAVAVSPLEERLRLEFPQPRPGVALEVLELRRP